MLFSLVWRPSEMYCANRHCGKNLKDKQHKVLQKGAHGVEYNVCYTCFAIAYRKCRGDFSKYLERK